MSEKWMDEITIDVVPEKYHYLVDLIGIENVLILAKNFGGTKLYIPMHDALARDIRNAKIRSDFNGGNYRELTKKYNLSESQIRNIINSDSLDGQLSLFT